LLRPAFVIAMLGGIESLLSAVVSDSMTGTKHNSNRELIGQGVANMVAPLFGGIPATGAIARTATNIKSGAVSPVSAIVHSVTVLLFLVILAPFASEIPLASIAPVLMLVAWNMSERKQFWALIKMRSSDSLVLAITFLLTVLTSLTNAVLVGLILAVLMLVKRMSEMLTVAKVLPDPTHKHEKVFSHMVKEDHDCPQISIFTVEGPLFFGVAQLFEDTIMARLKSNPTILLLRISKVPFMDTTGEANLASIVKYFKRRGGVVIITGLRSQPKEMMLKTGLYNIIGSKNFLENTGASIQYALTQLDYNRCLGCKHYAFRECDQLSEHLPEPLTLVDV